MKKNVVIMLIGIMLISTMTLVSLPAKSISNLNTPSGENDAFIADATSKLDIHFKWIGGATPIPVHFGTFSHYTESISKIEKWNDPSVEILKPGEKIIINFT